MEMMPQHLQPAIMILQSGDPNFNMFDPTWLPVSTRSNRIGHEARESNLGIFQVAAAWRFSDREQAEACKPSFIYPGTITISFYYAHVI
jgi:hypothetical protein